MSGGVDSSVAAALLARGGRGVIGVFLRNGVPEPEGPAALRGPPRCCGARDAADARRVADLCGFPFYALDRSEEFERLVGDFVADYARGRTPNPCVSCNRSVKIESLVRLADALGAETVATGHYARIARGAGGAARIRRAADLAKDQSYFLCALRPDQVRRVEFPIGDLTKSEVREVARSLGLPVAEKPESQEICFVAGRSYRDLVAARAPHAFRPGEFVTAEGEAIGRHGGVGAFTVGQRHGLGLGGGAPRFVLAIEPESARVVVGDESNLDRGEIRVESVTWPVGVPEGPVRAAVQIRHRHRAAAATVTPLPEDAARVVFDAPVRAPSPGQAAAFYGGEQGDEVIGAGWIGSTRRHGDRGTPFDTLRAGRRGDSSTGTSTSTRASSTTAVAAGAAGA